MLVFGTLEYILNDHIIFTPLFLYYVPCGDKNFSINMSFYPHELLIKFHF